MFKSKPFVIGYAVIVFLIVFFIALSIVCSVSQFEITYEVGSMGQQAQNVQDRLEAEYRGKSYLFLNRDDVAAVVEQEGGGYLELVSFSKQFPNKICATVREKAERYALVVEQDGTRYYVTVDEYGYVLAVHDDGNINNIGGSNVEVVGFPFQIPAVGELLVVPEGYAAAYTAFQDVVSVLEERLGGLRDNFLRIEYDETYAEYGIGSQLILQTREGVEIRLVDPETDAKAKIGTALDVYLQQATGIDGEGKPVEFTDAQRTYGVIVVLRGNGPAIYSPHPATAV